MSPNQEPPLHLIAAVVADWMFFSFGVPSMVLSFSPIPFTGFILVFSPLRVALSWLSSQSWPHTWRSVVPCSAIWGQAPFGYHHCGSKRTPLMLASVSGTTPIPVPTLAIMNLTWHLLFLFPYHLISMTRWCWQFTVKVFSIFLHFHCHYPLLDLHSYIPEFLF